MTVLPVAVAPFWPCDVCINTLENMIFDIKISEMKLRRGLKNETPLGLFKKFHKSS